MYLMILLKHDIACIFFDIDNADIGYLVESLSNRRKGSSTENQRKGNPTTGIELRSHVVRRRSEKLGLSLAPG